jgi:hypothetical protein
MVVFQGGFLTISSMNAVFVRLSTPIAVMFARHPLEIALHVGGTRIGYRWEYAYRYVHQIGFIDHGKLSNIHYLWYDTTSDPDESERVEWNLIVSPSLNVVIRLTDYASFDVSCGLRSSYLSLGVDL